MINEFLSNKNKKKKVGRYSLLHVIIFSIIVKSSVSMKNLDRGEICLLILLIIIIFTIITIITITITPCV